jgi:hypothetical protein
MLVADAPAIWLPPAPAIIRPADDLILRREFWPASREERRAALRDLVRAGRISREQAKEAVVWFAPPFFAPPKKPALAFLGPTSTTASSSSYSYSSVNIGAATADRLVIVGALWGSASGTQTVSSLSIGGTAATQVVMEGGGAGIFARLVSSGTTATIAVTFPSAVTSCGIYVWTLIDYQSSTAVDTVTDNSSPLSQSLTTSGGGVIVAVARASGSAGFTWTGLTEQDDGSVNASTALRLSAADLQDTAAGSTAIAVTPVGTTSPRLAAASWR